MATIKDKTLSLVKSQVQYLGGTIGTQVLNRIAMTRNSGPVRYTSPLGYNNVYTFMVKRDIIKTASKALEKFVSNETAKLMRIRREVDEKDKEHNRPNSVDLITNNNPEISYGHIQLKKTNNGTVDYWAKNEFGDIVKDALIIYFDDDVPYRYTDNNSQEEVNTVFFVDLSPSISVSSSKNVIMTKVQGRDATRKELIGGGDLVFQVSGNIMPQHPGSLNYKLRREYPTQEVNAFVKLMEHNGIINVLHYAFGNLNVTRCIIQDWNLPKQEYVNMQPYSFSCVAVEPDEAITSIDIINTLDNAVYNSPQDKWYNSVLDQNLANRLGDTSSSLLLKLLNIKI